MATVKQLKTQLNQVQNQLVELDRNYDRMQCQLREETADQMQKLRRDFNQALERQQDITQREYSQRFERFQRDILQLQQKQMLQIETQTAEYVLQQKQYLQQIDAIQSSMAEELARLKKMIVDERAVAKEAADSAYYDMLRARDDTDSRPHNFFLPNQFRIICQQADKVCEEINGGMYQSAIADANSAAMQYDILSVKTQNSLTDWYRAYNEFQCIVDGLQVQIDSFLHTPICGGVLCKKECNFWSKGRFERIRLDIKKAYTMITDVQEKGVVEYLKTIENPDRNAIYSAVVQAKIWQTQLAAILNCIVQECVKSHERYSLGEVVFQVLDKDGYQIKRNQFKEASEDDSSQDWYCMPPDENPFEPYEIAAAFDEKDIVHIHFVPVRDQGIVVRNECNIFIELQSIQSAKYEQNYVNSIYRKLSERLELFGCIQLIPRYYESDASVARMGCNVLEAVEHIECVRKQNADPDRQIKIMERKYIL